MSNLDLFFLKYRHIAAALLFVTFLAGCSISPTPTSTTRLIEPWLGLLPASQSESEPSQSGREENQGTPSLPMAVTGTPTPDPIREPPQLRTEAESYVVQPGDSLNSIAIHFGVSANQIARANAIHNQDVLSVWQALYIPAPEPQQPGPAHKILPDSELVFGPANRYVDIYSVVDHWYGYLRDYVEEVEGVQMSGAGIIHLVARRYSVNPLLLLGLLEYQGGWLTQLEPPPQSRYYPMGYAAYGWEGLFPQLSWAADQLNLGFYRWRADWSGPFILTDGHVINPGLGINAGTAGVQQLFSELYPAQVWRQVVGEAGFALAYANLFGNPFERGVEPLQPEGLKQPILQLPIEEGSIWSFTGGPHSAWGDYAGWAALDFAPPGNAFGCIVPDEWVVAAADGLVVRVENGEVLLDLDGDGYEHTGWVLLYMHIESRHRVEAGTYLQAGDLIGHASCEGGVATGTHLHLARKYNGEWIPADGSIPFEMDGWVSSGAGWPYDGYLSRGAVVLEACACRNELNQISR
jgi:murein DD-endopeptidase MepM/ murein hydrolase activator NlpD